MLNNDLYVLSSKNRFCESILNLALKIVGIAIINRDSDYYLYNCSA